MSIGRQVANTAAPKTVKVAARVPDRIRLVHVASKTVALYHPIDAIEITDPAYVARGGSEYRPADDEARDVLAQARARREKTEVEAA
jgi:hypothetical protein